MHYNDAKLAEVGRVIIPTLGRGVFSSTLGNAAPLPSPTLIFVVFLGGMKMASPHLLLLRWAGQFLSSLLSLAHTIIMAGGGGSWHIRRRRIVFVGVGWLDGDG